MEALVLVTMQEGTLGKERWGRGIGKMGRKRHRGSGEGERPKVGKGGGRQEGTLGEERGVGQGRRKGGWGGCGGQWRSGGDDKGSRTPSPPMRVIVF